MDHRTVLCSYCNNPLTINNPHTDQEVFCPICKRVTDVKALPFDVKELSFYAVNNPFCFISIIKEIESLKKQYIVLEPQLTTEDSEVLEFLKKTLVKTLNVRLDTLEDDVESFLSNAVNDILRTYDITLDFVSYQKILYFLKQKFIRFGAIDPLMNDANIEDISCDGSETPLFVYHREFGSLETNIVFPDEDNLSLFVVILAQKCGKHISVSNPMLDATMPDGSRIQMTLSGEVTTRGSTFTIRKFRSDPFTPVNLIEYNTFSLEMMAYLWMAVEHGFNALISGGTASGKTSTLNALALFIPKESKIVSIEETREINLPHPNWIPGVTRSGFGEIIDDRMVGEIDLFDLMKAALRQRPEYILVGEIRGQEAYVLFQAMATGHTTYSTIHADSTKSLIHRLEGKPINIPRNMLNSLDIIMLMRTQKSQDYQQRRCIKIVELLEIDSQTNEVLTNTVFEWNPSEMVFEYSGKSYVMEQIHSHLDMTYEEISNEIKNRSRIIEWLIKNQIREFTGVAHILAQYAETPEKIMGLIKKTHKESDKVIDETFFSENDEINSILDIKKTKSNTYSKKTATKSQILKQIVFSFNSSSKKNSLKESMLNDENESTLLQCVYCDEIFTVFDFNQPAASLACPYCDGQNKFYQISDGVEKKKISVYNHFKKKKISVYNHFKKKKIFVYNHFKKKKIFVYNHFKKNKHPLLAKKKTSYLPSLQKKGKKHKESFPSNEPVTDDYKPFDSQRKQGQEKKEKKTENLKSSY